MKTNVETMNSSSLGGVEASAFRSFNGGVPFDFSFGSSSVYRSEAEKPVKGPSSGLSKPRLVKLRKHLVSHHGRSTPVSGKQVDATASINPVRTPSNDGKVPEVSDQFSGWNPFATNSAQKGKGSISSGGVGEFAGGTLRDEMTKLSIGRETGEGNLNATELSKSNVFVFGSSSTAKSRLEEKTISKLPDKMKQLNIESSVSSEFVEKTNAANCTSKVNDQTTSTVGSSKNTAEAFRQTLEFKLPDIKNLNIRDCGNTGDAEKTKGSDINSKASGTTNDASNASCRNTGFGLHDEMNKLNIEDRAKKTEDPDFSSMKNDKSAFIFGISKDVPKRFFQSMETKVPDEMKKLNIKKDKIAGGVEKSNDPNFSSHTSSNNSQNLGIIDNASNDSSQSSECNLPDEIKRLNIEDYGSTRGFEKPEVADFSTKASKTFVFGCGKNLGGSSSRNSEVLPNEMKLNTQETVFVDGVESNVRANFKFQSKKFNDASISGSNLNVPLDRMKKLNIKSDSGAYPNAGFCSSRNSTKEMHTSKSDEMIFPKTAGIYTPAPYTFQGVQGTSLGANSVPLNVSRESEPSVFSSSFSVAGPGLQTNGNPFEVPKMEETEKKAEFSFTGPQDGLRTPLFKATKHDGPCSSTGNLAAGSNRKLEFSAKKAAKDTMLKKKKGKLKQPASVNQLHGKDYIPVGNSSQEKLESPGPYSPMDVSPYQETLADAQLHKEASAATDKLFQFDAKCASSNARPSVFVDTTHENLFAATQSLDTNKDDTRCKDLKEDAKCPREEFVAGAEAECRRCESEKMGTDGIMDREKIEADISLKIETQASDYRLKSCFTSSSDKVTDASFTFSASSSDQGNISPPKRQCRRRNRRKIGQDSESSILNAKIQFAFPSVPFFPLSGTATQSSSGHDNKEESSNSRSQGNILSEEDKETKVKDTRTSATASSQEACEKWRLRGNQAYSNGDLSKAEVYYTRGVNSAYPTASKSCLNALVLCYSNRAAARMSLGRMREALGDCKKAEAIDPKFFRVQVRAANCHLALGEIQDALRYFKNCLQSRDLCLDRKIVIEASDGLRKAQKAAEYIDRCAELLRPRKSSNAETALKIIAEALSISPLSEILVKMKAQALFILQRYEEVVKLCEQAITFAEKKCSSITSDEQLENLDGSESIVNSRTRIWCRCMIIKSYFYLGRLEEALDFLQKLQQVGPVTEMHGNEELKSMISLSVTVRELLHHKAVGNEAFQSGRHSEAVEHYTAALSRNVESRPFAAVCFCNRAAAHQALGQISDAIADCSLAIALNGSYAKAISRRATLYEMIRDYRKASTDIQRLVSLLENQKEYRTNQSGKLGRSTSCMSDLRQARSRLSTMEEEARKELPLNMYLILGIEPSVEAADIKKAYRKAALRHHPDKAGQLLPRSENGDDEVWKEIAEEVHRDADRLFKMIGEAYAILSDSTKRSRYDYGEEIRNTQKKGNRSNTSRSPDTHYDPCERSSNRRRWQAWKSYADSRWSEAYGSSRYY